MDSEQNAQLLFQAMFYICQEVVQKNFAWIQSSIQQSSMEEWRNVRQILSKQHCCADSWNMDPSNICHYEVYRLALHLMDVTQVIETYVDYSFSSMLKKIENEEGQNQYDIQKKRSERPLQFFRFLNKVSTKVRNQMRSGMLDNLRPLLNLPETVLEKILDHVIESGSPANHGEETKIIMFEENDEEWKMILWSVYTYLWRTLHQIEYYMFNAEDPRVAQWRNSFLLAVRRAGNNMMEMDAGWDDIDDIWQYDLDEQESKEGFFGKLFYEEM